MSSVMCSKPRVIAAEIKKDFCKDVIRERNGSKPHIAGELGLVGGTSSEPHWAEVRDGQLVVYPGPHGGCGPAWRIPLRHLHLQPAASGRPRGFSLTRHGEAEPIATFQVDSDLDYSRWVRTLAAELLKQTPLEAVKFLDILGITATIVPPEPHRSLSPEYHSEPECRCRSWELRCSPLPRGRSTPEPPRTAPRMQYQYHRPELTQPLSLMITEHPKLEVRRSSYRKALSFDSSPDDCVNAPRFPEPVDPICQTKQSKPRFRSCQKSRSNESINHNYPPVVEEIVEQSKVKSLLKTFSREILKDTTSQGPLHPLDIKDDGRTGRPPLPDVVKDLPPCDRRSRARTRTPAPLRTRGKSVDVLPSTENNHVAELIARCQQEDRYVPVRDKRLLFESLGRASSQPRFVLSSDNLTDLCDPVTVIPEPPRTQSLHDLTNNNVAVKEICRYFEQRGGSRGELVGRSPSPECRLRLPTPGPGPCKPLGPMEPLRPRGVERRLSKLRQTITDCEQNIWRLQDQADKLSHNRRGGSTRLQVAMECRLEEERERLKRLQDEHFKLQRELDSNPQPFGFTAAPRHHNNVR